MSTDLCSVEIDEAVETAIKVAFEHRTTNPNRMQKKFMSHGKNQELIVNDQYKEDKIYIYTEKPQKYTSLKIK